MQATIPLLCNPLVVCTFRRIVCFVLYRTGLSDLGEKN